MCYIAIAEPLDVQRIGLWFYTPMGLLVYNLTENTHNVIMGVSPIRCIVQTLSEVCQPFIEEDIKECGGE